MKKAEPDCATCYKKDTCENARAGCFCCMWQSKPPAATGPDPNEQWMRGD